MGEEALSSRGNTPDLMMTNVTTLKPSDSEAAQIEDEEQQEDRTGNANTCNEDFPAEAKEASRTPVPRNDLDGQVQKSQAHFC